MKKAMKTVVLAMLSAAVFALPVCAEEEPQMAHGEIEGELEDGIYTIRIQATDHDDPDMYWTAWDGDKGDASYVELLTQSDQEEGLAYAGSFMASPGAGDGEDFIRLVYTNGQYVAEYMDWNVSVKDDAIAEVTGGGQAFPTSGSDLAPVLEGTWEEEDGNLFMEISPEEDGSLLFVISSGGGRDGAATFYTMHAYYDAVKDALVYWDGEEVTAEITNGLEEAVTEEAAEEDAAEEALTEGGEESEEAAAGTGMFALEVQDEENVAILWRDDTFGNIDTGRFVKSGEAAEAVTEAETE